MRTDSFMTIKRFLVYLLLVTALVPGSGSARAAGAATVSVRPSATEVDLVVGKTVEIELYVTDGVAINAFEVTLAYDKDVVTLLCPYGGSSPCWQSGGFLNNLQVVMSDITPGSFFLAITQLDQPDVTGEGSLIRLTFQGAALGVSDIDISTAVFSNGDGVETEPLTKDGSLQVFPQRFNLIGALSRQGQGNTGGIPVNLGVGLIYGYGPYQIVSGAGGKLNLPFGKVVGDTYTFTTAQPGYLSPALQVTLSADLTLPPLRLLAGDVNADGLVDAADLEAIGAAFDASGSGLAADLNGDGVVNLQDLALAAGNYGLTPAEAYGDWLP